jgi:GNAT superfamily N-acetyltransferase
MPDTKPVEDLAIRDVAGADFPGLERLIHATMETCYPAAYCPEALAHFNEHHTPALIRERARTGRTIVLDASGRLVGTGSIISEHIEAVFVDPALQGRGFGKAIMGHLEAIGHDNGFDEFTLDATTTARAFHESLGYVVVEAASVPVDNGKTLDFFRMAKRVG